MERTDKTMLILLIVNVLFIAALVLTARNTAWDTKTGRFEGDDRLARGGSNNGACCQCDFGNCAADDAKRCSMGRDVDCRVGDAD
nr:MAG TPA: hypothetical protein [Caudoviricetes sp.]